MANYKSIPRRFNRPTSSINHAYIDKALKEKQNTIDSNFGLLQQTIEKTLGQDLIREKDRDILKGKVSDVLTSLNNTDSIQFDSKKSRFTIQGSLAEAAKDPYILQQIVNTKKIRDVQAFNKKRTDKGDLNQINFQHAYKASGIEGYVNGTSDDISDFKYLEHRDVPKKIRDASKEFQSMKNDTVIKWKDNEGNIFSKKKSQLTQQEWVAQLTGVLDAGDYAQMNITGSSMYNFDDNAAVADLESKKLEAIGPNLEEIANIEKKLHTADGATKAQLEKDLSDLTTKNKQIVTRFDKIGTNADAIGGYYVQNSLVNNMASFMAKSSEVTYDGVDQAYFKSKKASGGASTTATSGAGGNIDFNADGLPDMNSTAIGTDLREMQTLDLEVKFESDLANIDKDIITGATTAFKAMQDNASPKTKEVIKKYKMSLIDAGKTDEQATIESVVYFSGSNEGLMSYKDRDKFLENITLSTAMHDAKTVSAEASTEGIADPKLFDIISNNTNIRLHGIDDNVTLKGYLDSKNIKTREQYQTFMETDQGKELSASLLIQTSGIEVVSRSSVSGGRAYTMDISKEAKIRMAKIKELTGEELQVMYRGTPTLISQVPNGEHVDVLPPREGFMTNSLKSINRGGNPLWEDRIGTEESEMMDILGPNAIKKKYDVKFDIASAKIPGNNAIVLQETYGTKNQALLQKDLSSVLPNVALTGKNKVFLVKSKNGYDLFETQAITIKEKGESAVKGSQTVPLGTVSHEAMSNTRILKNLIERDNSKKEIEFALDKNFKTGPISYRNTNAKSATEQMEYLGKDNPLINFVDKETFLRNSKAFFKTSPEEYKNVELLINNANKFTVEYDSASISGGGGIGILQVKDLKGNVVKELRARSAEEAVNYYKYSRTIPEAFLSMAIFQNAKNDKDALQKMLTAIQQ